MKIPDSITVNTGEDFEIRKTIDRFFEEAISEIKKRTNEQEDPSEFKLESMNLCSINPIPIQSDNYVHILFYKEKVIAAVFETRTEMNYINFDYFLNIHKPL